VAKLQDNNMTGHFTIMMTGTSYVIDEGGNTASIHDSLVCPRGFEANMTMCTLRDTTPKVIIISQNLTEYDYSKRNQIIGGSIGAALGLIFILLTLVFTLLYFRS